jgi:uncharacterized protein YdaU (DUF1376 family)
VSSRPILPLFFSDLVGDTLHLSNGEFGSYMLLLGAMWNAKGHLPNDMKLLRRISRCGTRGWPATWALISPFFTVTEDGRIMHPKLLREVHRVQKSVDSNRHNLSAARTAKSLKRKKPPLSVQRHPDPDPGKSVAPSEQNALSPGALAAATPEGAASRRDRAEGGGGDVVRLEERRRIGEQFKALAKTMSKTEDAP